jgi:hypothetical protein
MESCTTGSAQSLLSRRNESDGSGLARGKFNPVSPALQGKTLWSSRDGGIPRDEEHGFPKEGIFSGSQKADISCANSTGRTYRVLTTREYNRIDL